MKPNDANTEYCIKYTEYVNGLRARRGGWQDGDWVFLNGKSRLIRRVRGSDYAIYTLIDSAWYKLEIGYVWLPSEGDVLGMLENVLDADQREQWHDTWQLTRDRFRGPYCAALIYDDDTYGLGETPLIALLELLKAVESK